MSAGFTEQDDLLAVGVVPIAVTKWWGDEPFEVWPWAQSKLRCARPEVLSFYDGGFQCERIAALRPDLIVAVDAGVDQDSYNQSSAIAPTIPQSGDARFFEPWKTQATTIGQATFQPDKLRSLITQTDNRINDVAPMPIRNSAAGTRSFCKVLCLKSRWAPLCPDGVLIS